MLDNPGDMTYNNEKDPHKNQIMEGSLDSFMIKYILFDLDGTLTDPAEGITRCVAYALDAFGIHAAPETLTDFIGPPLLEQFMAYAHFDRDTALRAVNKYRERFRDIGIFENRVLDGVPDMLKTLRENGHILAVASSKPEVFVRQVLDKYGLSDFFSIICGSELDGTRSKKAEVIEETLTRLAASFPNEDFSDRSRCLMVGDRIHDIEGAVACHMDAVGVTFGYAPEGELENSRAIAVISGWNELIKLIK